MYRFSFWFRWSLRQLRARWVQVAVIALVIAIGTGVYAGLASTSAWRQTSYDQSYAALNVHDLHASLSDGSYVTQGELAGALSDMQHPEWVDLAEERLLQPTQVETSTASETILVPGRVVGVPTNDGGPKVDEVYVSSGSGLSAPGGAVLEQHFVNQYKLPDQGTVELAGGVPVQYTGTGYSPEYFMVTTGQGNLPTPGDFAVLFMPLDVVQDLAGRAGEVNDLVLKLAPGIDRNEAQAEVEQAFAARLPQLAVQVKTLEDDPAYHMLYNDLHNAQGILLALALLVLLGAAFAAFNLTSRVVEAERREIGISMALGVPRAKIALRPLLMGAEIAGLGIIFGIGMGFLMGALMRPALSSMQPLPIWRTPFQVAPFASAAAVGFLLPFLATAWPVWRAVRVEPVQAIQTGHLASKGGGLAPVFKRFHLPGRSLAQMPLRNVLRAPRRTILTALGIGASIVLLIVVLGSLDSFDGILNRVSSEMNRGAPDRIAVILANFQPQDSDLIRTIKANPSVGMVEPVMIGTAKISNGDKELDMMLQAQNMASPVWNPTVESPADPGGLPGIVLPEKAASDLGLKPGDTLTMTHPYRTSGTTFALKQSEVRLVGLNPMPVRILAYMDLSSATELLGIQGLTNGLQIAPAAGQTVFDVKQAIFNLPGVASTQAPTAMLDLARDKIRQFSGIFNIIAGFIFLLALLIAFSAASISADEHRRENATMQAYGVRVRSLLRMAVVESGVVGIMGSLVGAGLGFLALGWLLGRFTSIMPDIQIKETLTGASILITFLIGIAATAIAPLFNARKLRKMDIPSTLRVME